MKDQSLPVDKNLIKNFISGKLLNDRDIDCSENLLLSGLVDSLGIVKMLFFLEEEFDVKIPPRDVTIANMASIDTISVYISELREQSNHP